MQWVTALIESIARGDSPFDGLWLPGRGERSASIRRAAAALDRLDAALDGSAAEQLRAIEALTDATTDWTGRLALSLGRAPGDDHPEVPAYFQGWFPQLEALGFAAPEISLAVHLLLAEIRTRLADSSQGTSRPQDFLVGALLLRQALSTTPPPHDYAQRLSGGDPRRAQRFTAALHGIRGGFLGGRSQRFYRAQDTALRVIELDHPDPWVRGEARRSRSLASSELGIRARRLQRVLLLAGDLLRRCRAARKEIDCCPDASQECLQRCSREAAEATTELARLLLTVGLGARVKGLRDIADRRATWPPFAVDPLAARALCARASDRATRATSELRKLAAEASRSADATQARLPRSQPAPAPAVRRPFLPHLRAALEVP